MDGVAQGVDIQLPRGSTEFHQIHAGQVAGGVVQEHVFAARIGGVDRPGAGAGVPVVDGGVELDPGIAANPGRVRHLAEDVACAVGIDRLLAQHPDG